MAWWPVFHGIGRSAATCVPIARYSNVGTWPGEIGLTSQPTATIATPSAMTLTR